MGPILDGSVGAHFTLDITVFRAQSGQNLTRIDQKPLNCQFSVFSMFRPVLPKKGGIVEKSIIIDIRAPLTVPGLALDWP